MHAAILKFPQTSPRAFLLIGAIIWFVLYKSPEPFSHVLVGAVPISVLVGVPMYTNAAGIIPIVEAPLAKGAALGTELAFMMSVIVLSGTAGATLCAARLTHSKPVTDKGNTR